MRPDVALPNVGRILRTLEMLMDKFRRWIVPQNGKEWGQFEFVCKDSLSEINLHDFLTTLTLKDWDQEYNDFHDNCMNEWDGFYFYDIQVAYRKWSCLQHHLLHRFLYKHTPYDDDDDDYVV